MTDPGAAAGARVVLAVVTGAHGTRGEVKLKSFTVEPGAIADYGLLERSDGGKPLEIVAIRPAKQGLIARFAGISERNEAERLKDVELSVARDRLPEPAPEEYYHADLVGLAAERPDGTVLGEIIAVHNFGAGDILEVRLAEGVQTVLVPFTRETVPDIDISRRRLVVDPPEGLLED
jgi:16S rRNA processing protein RimM